MTKTVCLVLAGKRPSDRMSQHFGVENKALIDLNGKPLIHWVLDALNTFESSLIVSITPGQKEIFEQSLAEYRFQFLMTASNDSPVDAVFKAFGQLAPEDELLITTADNPLLNKDILEHFLGSAQNSQAELIIGTVNGHDGLIDRFPNMKRTWHKLNEETWLSGANLFYWKPRHLSQDTHQVMLKLESQRKSPIAFASTVSKIDWYFFVKLLTQKTNLAECNSALSKATGINIELITLPFMEACIDVDKPEDLALAELFLRERNGLLDESSNFQTLKEKLQAASNEPNPRENTSALTVQTKLN